MSIEEKFIKGGLSGKYTTKHLDIAQRYGITVDELRPFVLREFGEAEAAEKLAAADQQAGNAQASREKHIRSQFSALSGGGL